MFVFERENEGLEKKNEKERIVMGNTCICNITVSTIYYIHLSHLSYLTHKTQTNREPSPSVAR
jgi:hypothetical protein